MQQPIFICSRKLVKSLGLLVICLIFAGLTTHLASSFTGHPSIFGLVRLFDLDYENNVPTWYQSLTLLFCSILLAAIAFEKKIKSSSWFYQWRNLSIIFLFLSLDEMVSIHEMLVQPLKQGLHTSGLLTYAWVIPGAIFVLIVFLKYLKFLLFLPVKTRNLFLLAGTLYVGGAIGLEMVGGYINNLYGSENLMYLAEVIGEEFLEMSGVLVFIYALLSYISLHVKYVQVHIFDRSPSKYYAIGDNAMPTQRLRS